MSFNFGSFDPNCGLRVELAGLLPEKLSIRIDISSDPPRANWSARYCEVLSGNLKTMYPHINTNCYVSDYFSLPYVSKLGYMFK